MDNNLLVNYAFAKSVYDEKRNFLDSFAPFVLQIFSTRPKGKENLNATELRAFLQLNFNLSIPNNTLVTITDHLRRQKYLEGKNEYRQVPYHKITEKGLKFIQDSTSSLNEIERRQN
jgi:hypothetical protein